MSTLGYGRHAQSTLFGRFIYQNQDRDSRFDPHAAQYAGRPRSPALEAAIDLVAGLEHGGVVESARLRETHGDDVWRALDALLERLERAGHLDRAGGTIRATGLTPAGVTWLAQQVTPSAAEAAPPGQGICIVERGRTWRIRLEPARRDAHYFAVVGGVGLFYQIDPASKPDPALVTRIMAATVRHAERLLGSGCPERDLAARIAAILDERLAAVGLGIGAKVEATQPKRHRLTTVAGG
jgi:hypothetical protein